MHCPTEAPTTWGKTVHTTRIQCVNHREGKPTARWVLGHFWVREKELKFPQKANVNKPAWPRQAVLKKCVERPGQIQGSVELCHSLCKKARDTGQLSAVRPWGSCMGTACWTSFSKQRDPVQLNILWELFWQTFAKMSEKPCPSSLCHISPRTTYTLSGETEATRSPQNLKHLHT